MAKPAEKIFPSSPLINIPLVSTTTEPHTLVLLDFDGFLIDSYSLLRNTFKYFGLDVGDEERFTHRRKFLKYLGGGKEFVKNFVYFSLPKKKEIREHLTNEYLSNGYIYPEFVQLLNRLIASQEYHVGIVSRNYTYSPGLTIRRVLRNSEVNEKDLDFIVPVSTGARKNDVLEAMQSSRYRKSLFGADEIGDYKAAMEAGYEPLIASYGFDSRHRLLEKGGVAPEIVFETPSALVTELERLLDT